MSANENISMSEIKTERNITQNSDIKIEKEYSPNNSSITEKIDEKKNEKVEKKVDEKVEKKVDEKVEEKVLYEISQRNILYKWNVTEISTSRFEEPLVYLLYLIQTDSKVNEIKDIDIGRIRKELGEIDMLNFPWHMLPRNVFISVFNLLKTETVFFIAGYYRISGKMGKTPLIEAMYDHFIYCASKNKTV